mmetsp:Transcript_13952/g.24447  ORF Transcript_13952/g.24447 Transcript_13952/m.24447 type:complete len:300 (+) Transcript_13952:213-1112(+)
MQPDFDKLESEYKKSRSTLLVQVDCASPGGQGLCGKMGIQGYPSMKVFKKGGNIFKGEDYNGGRDFGSLKRYVEANLAGPECSLEDKEGCEKDELKILEESEAMKPADRKAKIKGMEDEIKDKKKQMKQLEKEVKEIEKNLGLVKAGGEKPDKVEQLLGDTEFREHCESRTCVLAFLPHILDGGASARNGYLKTLDSAFKKAKADGQPVGFMWLQGGDQFEIEEKMALSFGFPAVIAVSLKKERFGIHRGTFDKSALSSFLSQMMVGRVPLQPLPKGLKWAKSDPWDGKDGEVPVEEEL